MVEWKVVPCSHESTSGLEKKTSASSLGKFECRYIEENSLFDIHTRIQMYPTEETKLPKFWSAASSDGRTCVAIDNHVYIFNYECTCMDASFDFEHHVTHIAWGGNSSFLVIADTGGAIHLLDSATKRVLLSQRLLKSCSEDSFIAVAFFRSNTSDLYEFFVCTKNGMLYRFSHVDLALLSDCIERSDLGGIKQLKAAISLSKESIISEFPNKVEVVDGIYVSQSFTGENILIAWSGSQVVLFQTTSNSYTIQDTFDSLPFLGADIIKCRHSVSNHHDFLIIFDKTGTVSVWYMPALIIVNKLPAQAVSLYTFPKNGTGTSNSITATVTAMGDTLQDTKCLQLMDSTSLQIQCSFHVSEHTLLVESSRQDDMIILLEAQNNRERGTIEAITIRTLVPTIPRDRFYFLLQQGKYDEALKLAHQYEELNPNIVHEVRVNSLLDKSHNDNDSKNLTNVDDLIQALDQVQDVAFVVQSALQAPLHSTQQIHALLAYAHNRLNLHEQQCKQQPSNVGTSDDENGLDIDVYSLNAQILTAMNRLTTFQLASHGNFSSAEWLRFIDANLLKELLLAASSGRIGTASILWYRHMRECSFQDHIVAILSAIPDVVPASRFVKWFENDIVPSVMRQDHAFVIDWVHQRCMGMEITESEEWPRSALDLISAADELLVMYGCSRKTSSLAVRSMSGSHYPGHFVQMLCGDRQGSGKQETCDPAQASARQLAVLRTQLEDMEYLQDHSGYKTTLRKYKEDTATSIMIQMLDQTSTCDLILEVIQNDIVPYAARHNICVDSILDTYVSHLATLQKKRGSSLLSSSWTGKAVAIIPIISDEQKKVKATIELMRCIHVPCHPDVFALFEEAKSWPAANSQEFQNHYQILNLKSMLLPYGMANENLSNPRVAHNLIKAIVSKLDIDSAVEDALQVVLAYNHLSSTNVYVSRIRHLCRSRRITDAQNLLASINSHSLVLSVIHETLAWILEVCADANTFDGTLEDWLDIITFGAYLYEKFEKNGNASAHVSRNPSRAMDISHSNEYRSSLNTKQILNALIRGWYEFGLRIGTSEFKSERSRKTLAAKFLGKIVQDAQETGKKRIQTDHNQIVLGDQIENQSSSSKYFGIRQQILRVSQLLYISLSEMVRLACKWLLNMQCIEKHVAILLDVSCDIMTRQPTPGDAVRILEVCELLLKATNILFSSHDQRSVQMSLVNYLRRIKHICNLCIATCSSAILMDAIELGRNCDLALQLTVHCEHSSDEHLHEQEFDLSLSKISTPMIHMNNNSFGKVAERQKSTSVNKKVKRKKESTDDEIQLLSEEQGNKVISEKCTLDALNGRSTTCQHTYCSYEVPDGILLSSKASTLNSKDHYSQNLCNSDRILSENENDIQPNESLNTMEVQKALYSFRQLLQESVMPDGGFVLEPDPIVTDIVCLAKCMLIENDQAIFSLDQPVFERTLMFEHRCLIGCYPEHGDLSSALSVCFHLHETLTQHSHTILALSVATYASGLCAQYYHLHTTGEQTYFRGIELIGSKLSHTTKILLATCISKPLPEMGLGSAYLSVIPLIDGITTVRHAVKTSRQKYKKLAKLALLGCADALLWQNEEVFRECTQIHQNALWWNRLVLYDIPVKREQLSIAQPSFSFPAILQKSDFDLSLCLDLAQDYGIRHELIYYAFIETLCTTKSIQALYTDTFGKKTIRSDLKENAMYIIGLLKDPETIADILVNKCFLAISPYDYERLAFVFDLLERVLKCTNQDYGFEVRTATSTAAKQSQSSKQLGEKMTKNWNKEKIIQTRLVRDVLTRFKRTQLPTTEEYIYTTDVLGQTVDDEQKQLSTCRLPFHHLIFGDALEVLKPELSLTSIDKLLPLAKLLQISTDDMFTLVIGEALTKGLNHFNDLACGNIDNITKDLDRYGNDCSFHSRISIRECAQTSKFDHVMALLRKIRNVECAVACAKEISDVLAVGSDKITVLEFAVEITKQWLQSSDSPDKKQKVMKANCRFQGMLQTTKISYLLQSAHISNDDTLTLVDRPEDLILYLLEHYTVGAPAAKLTANQHDLYTIITEIGELHGVDADALRLRHIEECLKGSAVSGMEDDKENLRQNRRNVRQQQSTSRHKSFFESSKDIGERQLSITRSLNHGGNVFSLGNVWDEESDADVLLRDTGDNRKGIQYSGAVGKSFAGHQTIVHETVETADVMSLSLHRAISMLRMVDIGDSVRFLIKFAMVEGSTKITLKARVRACIALFSITTLSVVSKIIEESPETLQNHLVSLIYAARLEDIGIYQTPLQFERTNKASIAKSILRNHATDASALELVVHLCLDFALFELSLWERILQNVMALQDYELLAVVLVSIASAEELWYLATLERAWLATLQYFVEKVEDVDEECEKAIRLMLKSPLTMHYKTPLLIDACMRTGKEHLAIVCAFCHAESEEQLHMIQRKMTMDKAERCLSVLETSTLPVLDKVKYVLEKWVEK